MRASQLAGGDDGNAWHALGLLGERLRQDEDEPRLRVVHQLERGAAVHGPRDDLQVRQRHVPRADGHEVVGEALHTAGRQAERAVLEAREQEGLVVRKAQRNLLRRRRGRAEGARASAREPPRSRVRRQARIRCWREGAARAWSAAERLATSTDSAVSAPTVPPAGRLTLADSGHGQT